MALARCVRSSQSTHEVPPTPSTVPAVRDHRAVHHDPAVRDLRALPKAHLHVHLEGAMRPHTLNHLAGRYGVTVPPPRERYGTFADFADFADL